MSFATLVGFENCSTKEKIQICILEVSPCSLGGRDDVGELVVPRGNIGDKPVESLGLSQAWTWAGLHFKTRSICGEESVSGCPALMTKPWSPQIQSLSS